MEMEEAEEEKRSRSQLAGKSKRLNLKYYEGMILNEGL
jgi:hypothetical protein